MRKIFLTAVVVLIVSVQSLCGAAEVYSDFFNDEADLIYPVVRTGDKAIDKKINGAIIAEIDRFLTGVYRTAQKNDYEIADMRTNFEVPCNQAGDTVILSILITESNYYTGGAHPATYKHALNFNLSNGELIDLDYLTDVGEGIPKDYLIEKLTQRLREYRQDKGTYLFDDALPLKELPQDFYWDDKLKLHFIFQHYQIAPYAAGIIDVDLDD
ncbi:MAG: DUF4163 domain-containing protein [Selenomonadaceae bacterium]|nr:DUF4163 domain-containing protein [Selenomonadaceae bacterium]